MAYDELKRHHAVTKAGKEYLLILKLAAKESEFAVDDVLRILLERNRPISAEIVERLVLSDQKPEPVTEVSISPVVLHAYDCLLGTAEVTV